MTRYVRSHFALVYGLAIAVGMSLAGNVYASRQLARLEDRLADVEATTQAYHIAGEDDGDGCTYDKDGDATAGPGSCYAPVDELPPGNGSAECETYKEEIRAAYRADPAGYGGQAQLAEDLGDLPRGICGETD